MTIEEEIKILENALSGALLVPSECAFVSTEIIKICLDTLKTYESWEDLIRFELEKQIKADAEREFQNSDYWNDYLAKVIADAKAEVIETIKESIHEIYHCQFYCMADMCEHDSPTVDMCIDCFYETIEKKLEQLKEQKND